MAVDNLSKRISDLTQYLEDLKTRGISEPGNTAEILSDAVDELQISLEELSTMDKLFLPFGLLEMTISRKGDMQALA
jgi:hypothetical protein